MTEYLYFGEFAVLKDTITSIEGTVDVDGNPCVLIKYGLNSSILLYDDAAEAAIRWSKDQAIKSLYEKGNKEMPQPISYDKRPEPKPKNQSPQRHPNKAEQEKERAEKAKRANEMRSTVLQHIGHPSDLILVDCKELWDQHHFRVNVYRRINGKRNIANSYFVELLPDGLVSNPPMEPIRE